MKDLNQNSDVVASAVFSGLVSENLYVDARESAIEDCRFQIEDLQSMFFERLNVDVAGQTICNWQSEIFNSPEFCAEVSAQNSGDNSVVVPPVPIPNTEVKRCSPNGSTATGRARVGRRQNKNPDEFSHRGFCFSGDSTEGGRRPKRIERPRTARWTVKVAAATW